MNFEEDIGSRIVNATSLEESIKVLEMLLSKGFSIWSDGSLYYTKQLVAQVNGLRIEVFSREHPPPHFHISGGGIDATFSITTCEHLKGKVSGREKDLIQWWYKRSRPMLIKTWNDTRPTNCPVGPIEEQDQ